MVRCLAGQSSPRRDEPGGGGRPREFLAGMTLAARIMAHPEVHERLASSQNLNDAI
jgi:hypothetical protein